MVTDYDIIVADETGIPYVIIPARELWNFAEYLSYRREKVSFSYQSNHFTVAFPCCDRGAAQALLHDWLTFASTESMSDYRHSQSAA
jgi:hypothetical protein